MRTLFKSIVIISLVLVSIVVIVTQLISTQELLAQVNAKVEQATGRTLTVNGEHNLRVFPSLLLELQDVHLANMPNGSTKNMVNISEVIIHIPWLSIFSGELTVEKFVLNSPEILLEKTLDGTTNWQFFTDKDTNANTPSTNKAAKAIIKPSNANVPEHFDISLGQVAINNGKLTFINHQTNDTKAIEQLNVALILPSLRKPLKLSGSFSYMSQQLELESSITTPAQAINNQPFSLQLTLSSDLVKLTYQGDVVNQGQELNGNIFVSGESLKQLLNWQNMSVDAKEEAFNQFTLATNMHFADNKLSFSELKVELDELVFKGSSDIILSNPIQINSRLDLGILNLNPYLPEPPLVEVPPDDSENNPVVWDNTALDLSVLAALNAELNIHSDQLLVRDIKLGKNEIAVTISNSEAKVQLLTFQGYDGEGHGAFKINASKKPYLISSDFELSNIDAGPLLSDALGFDKLMGKGKLTWQISTTGISQRDFIEQLDGKLGIKFNDGAIKGFNLAAIAKSASNVMTGNFSSVTLDSDFSNAEKTDFAQLSADFTLSKGVAKTDNLALTNPFIRVAGQGDIDLPKTAVKIHIKSKLVASVQGQANQEASSGVEIPIKIIGPFHQINIRPDVSSDAKDKLKEKAKDKIKDKLKGLFGY